jgi:hypothetical protein
MGMQRTSMPPKRKDGNGDLAASRSGAGALFKVRTQALESRFHADTVDKWPDSLRLVSEATVFFKKMNAGGPGSDFVRIFTNRCFNPPAIIWAASFRIVNWRLTDGHFDRGR